MDQRQKDGLDSLEKLGYLPELRQLARIMCAAIWWHGTDDEGQYRIFRNGTICFLHTGQRLIAVTADHVYRQYLADKERYRDFSCQFGGSTIVPETYLIARDEKLDLATFEFPEVLVAPANVSVHHPPKWPIDPLKVGEFVLAGGYPGILREAKATVAELPFQSLGSKVTSVTEENIALQFDPSDIHWPLHPGESLNMILGGMSGGPIFRLIEGPPVDRLELVGFIYEHSEEYGLMFARHAAHIQADGKIV